MSVSEILQWSVQMESVWRLQCLCPDRSQLEVSRQSSGMAGGWPSVSHILFLHANDQPFSQR